MEKRQDCGLQDDHVLNPRVPTARQPLGDMYLSLSQLWTLVPVLMDA